MILGQPKTLSEFQPLSREEFDRAAHIVSALLEQGIPLDLPQGLLLGDLCRLVRTAQDAFVEPVPTFAEERPRLIFPE